MSTTTETWYKCSHCGFETSSDPKSKEHVQLHSSASPYGIPLVSCRICLRWVLPSDEFKYHIDNYHTTLPHTKGVVVSRKSRAYFNCELCPYKSRNRASMRNHASLHKPGPGSVTCSYCGWPGTVATVRSHKFTYHPKEYQNELNDNDVEEELPFKTLKLGKRKKVSYMCKECGYQCISKPYILRHLELHRPDGPKSISCSHCGWLAVATKINQHIAARHPGQGIGVPNRRMRRKVPTKPVPYHKCGECGYLVRRPVELAKHLKLHESGEGQICEECGWLCRNIPSHRSSWHPEKGTKRAKVWEKNKMKPVRKVNKEGEEEKAEETVMEDDSNGNDPNPKFVKITHNSKPAFKCTACGHIKTKKDETLKHLKLHEEGSDAVQCGICGWIIVKGKLKWHTRHYHGRKKLVKRAKPVEKGRPHFRCELCGFFSTMLLTVRDHLETHERGDGRDSLCGVWVVVLRYQFP